MGMMHGLDPPLNQRGPEWPSQRVGCPTDSLLIRPAWTACVALPVPRRACVQDSDFRQQFARFDMNGNGVLDPKEVVMLLKSAMPALTPQQLRYALMHLKQYDLDGDGCLNEKEIMIALRAVDVRVHK